MSLTQSTNIFFWYVFDVKEAPFHVFLNCFVIECNRAINSSLIFGPLADVEKNSFTENKFAPPEEKWLICCSYFHQLIHKFPYKIFNFWMWIIFCLDVWLKELGEVAWKELWGRVFEGLNEGPTRGPPSKGCNDVINFEETPRIA